MKKEFTLEYVQHLEFEILRYLKAVCEQHNLRYYLAYGTLIGAVRHQGFIPWDDDIDIMMPRKDYQCLLAVVSENPHPYYKLISSETDEHFQVPLPKFVDTRTILIQDYDLIEPVPLGVYVDIFLIDGAGNDYEAACQHYNDAFRYYQSWKKSRLKLFPSTMNPVKGMLRWFKNLPYKCKGSQHYMQQLTKHNTQYAYDESEYVATFQTGTQNPKKCVWHYADFGRGEYLAFNGELFQVPRQYHKILESEYGDYLTLPPKEKQVSHHSYDLRWNDTIR